MYEMYCKVTYVTNFYYIIHTTQVEKTRKPAEISSTYFLSHFFLREINKAESEEKRQRGKKIAFRADFHFMTKSRQQFISETHQQ